MSSPTHNNEVAEVILSMASAVRLAFVVYVLAAVLGCATQSPEKTGPTAAELDDMGEKAVASLVETKPGVREVVDKSVGYVVINMTVTKIPWVGAGTGYGVVVDKRTDTRSYIRVSRFEVGGGWGAQKFKVIIVFDDEKLLERVATGAWHYEAGAEVAAGGTSAEVGTGGAAAEGAPSKSGQGYRAYKLAEGGAAATVTVRLAYAKPYLND